MRDPLGRAKLAQSFGALRLSLGDEVGSEALLRSAWQARTQELGPAHPETERAAILLANACAKVGKHQEAITLIEQVRDRRLADPDATKASLRDLDEELAHAYQYANRLVDAQRMFESVCRSFDAEGGPDTRERLAAMHALAATLRMRGEDRLAIEKLQDVHARRSKLLGPTATETLVSADSLAVAYLSQDRAAEADRLLTATRDALLERFPRDHPTVITIESNLAGALASEGRQAESLQMLQQLVQRATARHGAESQVALSQMWGLARGLTDAGQWQEAATWLERCLPGLTRIHREEHPVMAHARELLVSAYQRIGREAEAITLLRDTLAAVTRRLGDEHPFTLHMRSLLVASEADAGKRPDAIPELQAIAAAQQRVLGEDHADTVITRQKLGVLLCQAGQVEPAIETLTAVLAVHERKLGADSMFTLEVQSMLGNAFWQAKRFDRSIPLLEAALRGMRKRYGDPARSTVQTALNLAANHRDNGDEPAMVALLTEFLPIAAASPGFDGPFLQELADALGAVYLKAGRWAEAAPALEIDHRLLVKLLGADHDDALAIGGNLASAWWSAGKLDRSLPLFEDLLPRARRRYGDEDPRTLMLAANLAVNRRDAGRIDDALPLFDEVMRGLPKLAPDAKAKLSFAATERLTTLARSGRRAELLAGIAARLSEVRAQLPAGSLPLAGELSSLGLLQLEADAFADAEPLLRECVAIRTAQIPDAWNTYNALSLLGGALLGLQRHAEAAPWILQGAEGLLQRLDQVPLQGRHRPREAYERVRQLYTSWHALEPTAGHDRELAEWLGKHPAPEAR